MPNDRFLARTAWLAPVALAAIVWWPLTRSYFHFDDFLDLYQLRNDDAARYFLRMYGGHVLIVRHAVTAALDTLFGPEPRAFFAVMLGTHLLNTGLLHAIVRRLTGGWPLAVLAAALWSTSAINEGALGWWAVYGQVAATSCVLFTLLALLRVGGGGAAGARAAAGWALVMLLAGMLFGIGIAAAMVMPVVAALLLPPGGPRRRGIAAFTVTAALLVVTYAVLRGLEQPLYGQRRIETTVVFALLTPSAASLHLSMLGALFAFGLGTLPIGALANPKDFPTAVHLAAVAVGALLLVAGLWAGDWRLRRRVLACLLLVAAMYGLIALARSMFTESVGLALLVGSLRYHYATGALLTAALAAAGAALADRLRPPAPLLWILGAVVALAIGWSAIGVAPRIDNFDGDRAATAGVLAEIRAAVAAAPPGATVEIANRPFGNVGFMNFGYRDRFPGTAAVFAIFYPDDVVDGRRVVFTTSDLLVLEGARNGRRSATLLRELPVPQAADKDSPP